MDIETSEEQCCGAGVAKEPFFAGGALKGKIGFGGASFPDPEAE
jgi:hypothetical protein